MAEPIRVHFDLGSYGDTITGTISTAYLLGTIWPSVHHHIDIKLNSNSQSVRPDGVALYQDFSRWLHRQGNVADQW